MIHNFDEYVERRGTDCKKYSKYPEDVIPMWIADTDFKSPAPVVEALVKRMEEGIYGYSVISPRLCSAVAGWQKKRFGWDVKNEDVEFSPGVIPGIISAVRAFSEKGDRVIVQTPCYPPFMDLLKHNGREIVRNPLLLRNGRYEIDFENLEKNLSDEKSKIMIICNPHNPSGRVFTKEELLKMGNLCLKYNVIVLADEIHGDIVYKGHKHIPFASICDKFANNSVTFVNPSKTFNLAGFRTGAFIAPNHRLKEKVHEELTASKIFGENICGTLALCTSYEECEYYADELVDYLQENLNILKEELKNIKGITPVKAEGTYLIFLDCRGLGLNQDKLDRFLVEKAHLGMNSGTSFGPEGEGFVRMNIACPKSVLKKALAQLKDAVDNLAE